VGLLGSVPARFPPFFFLFICHTVQPDDAEVDSNAEALAVEAELSIHPYYHFPPAQSNLMMFVTP
jgi:hypothetical protein